MQNNRSRKIGRHEPERELFRADRLSGAHGHKSGGSGWGRSESSLMQVLVTPLQFMACETRGHSASPSAMWTEAIAATESGIPSRSDVITAGRRVLPC